MTVRYFYTGFDNLIYPCVIAMTGIIGFLGTIVLAIMEADWLFANSGRLVGNGGLDIVHSAADFAKFGPFAQLFVATLIISVGGIAWWAKVTQNNLNSHRKRNDELIKLIIKMNDDKDLVIAEKDRLIEKLSVKE